MAYFSTFPLIFPFRFGVAPAGNPPVRNYNVTVVPTLDVKAKVPTRNMTAKVP